MNLLSIFKSSKRINQKSDYLVLEKPESIKRLEKSLTKIEPLEFKQICPLWSSVIEQVYSGQCKTKFRVKGKELDLQSAKYCIVGEGHGFLPDDKHDNYECGDCCRFSISFWECRRTYIGFHALITSFVEHYNQVHVSEIQKNGSVE